MIDMTWILNVLLSQNTAEYTIEAKLRWARENYWTFDSTRQFLTILEGKIEENRRRGLGKATRIK